MHQFEESAPVEAQVEMSVPTEVRRLVYPTPYPTEHHLAGLARSVLNFPAEVHLVLEHQAGVHQVEQFVPIVIVAALAVCHPDPFEAEAFVLAEDLPDQAANHQFELIPFGAHQPGLERFVQAAVHLRVMFVLIGARQLELFGQTEVHQSVAGVLVPAEVHQSDPAGVHRPQPVASNHFPT